MLVQAKVITAGPKGNSCRICKNKVKAPNLLMKAHGEFNRFSGHQKIDNYCPNCALEALDTGIATLKKLKEVLKAGHSESGELDLGSRKKTRVI